MCELDHSRADRLLKYARQGQREAVGQLLELYRNYMSLLVRMSMPTELRRKSMHRILCKMPVCRFTAESGSFTAARKRNS